MCKCTCTIGYTSQRSATLMCLLLQVEIAIIVDEKEQLMDKIANLESSVQSVSNLPKS